MMWLPRALRQSLQARLLIIGSLPLLLITSLLTATNIYIRQGDITATMNQSGHRMVDHLSRTADFALYTNNQSLLVSIANSIERMPNILGVAFLDSKRRVLLPSASFPARESISLTEPLGAGPRQYDDFLLFEKPVYTTSLEVEDYPDSEQLAVTREILGWVVVAIDLASARKQQRDIIFTSIGLAAGVMGTAFLLALALSRSVLTPIRKLTQTVDSLQCGDLSARALVSTEDELSILATGINHLAESVARSRSNLEQRVSTATVAVTRALKDLQTKNTALQQATAAALQASEEAEAANHAKTDFLARMSHELRTPLTSIQGFVRLLEQSPLDSSDKHYCQIIDSASSQLLTMINDILEFTKLQSGAQTVINEPYDVFECIEQPIQLLAPAAHHKGIELYCDFDPDIPDRLIGDAMRIRQIMTNLVGNAIKFTERGSVTIRISIDRQDPLHDKMIIAVSDTGIGMSPAQQEQIFEAFVQADTTISRRFGGTGLGLPIVKAYTNLMGGTIHFHSNPGKGTLCRIVLPLTQQLPKPQAADIPGPVLLYDTDERSRNACRHLLTRITKELIEAASFDELIDTLAEHTPTAVLINWSLGEPEHQQMAALEYVIDNLPCPVIVQAPLQVIREQLPEALVNGHATAFFIAKPAGLAELKAALLNVGSTSNENDANVNLDGVQVLVAEDNEFSRLLLCTLLARTGCQYQQASNGREAISACQKTHYDVLLIDLHMPEVTGVEAIHEIRQTDNPNRDTPVIVLTADVLIDVRRELGPLTVERIINKPFDEKQLLQALFELSGRLGAPSPQMLDSAASISKESYFAEIYRLLSNINTARNARDTDAMKEFCHQLSGIAAVYHLGDLDEQVKLLHTLVRAEEIDRIDDAVNSIRLETTKLKRADEGRAAPAPA